MSHHPIPTAGKPQDDWDKRPYLIIGGTTKAATTSLFAYLGAHPHVCMSNMKETRFFLDQDYPLYSKYRLEDGAEKYTEFFNQSHPTTRLWVEATPDYLYSKGSPAKIQRTLTNVRLVFILREPKARVVSWYRFARQNNQLPETMSLDEYVIRQLSAKNEDMDKLDQHMRAVEQGRYALYLRPYFETFGKERVVVVFMEELARDPKKVLQELCDFVDIDPIFYDSYKFDIYNLTENLKNTTVHGYYKRMLFYLHPKVHNRPAVKSFLRGIRHIIEPVYLNLNRRPPFPGIEIPLQVVTALHSYYESANKELAEMLGRSLPWDGE